MNQKKTKGKNKMNNKQILISIQSADIRKTKNLFNKFLTETNNYINDSKTSLEILYHVNNLNVALNRNINKFIN